MKKSLALRPQLDSLDSRALLSAVPGAEGLAGAAVVSPAQSHVVTMSGTVRETYHSPFNRIDEPRYQVFLGELSIDGNTEHVRIEAHVKLIPDASGRSFTPEGTMKIATHDPHRGDIDLSFTFSLASGYTYSVTGGTQSYHEGSGSGSLEYGYSGAEVLLTFR
jgi:hypothetical protein